MGQTCTHHCLGSLQMRSGRVHAEQDVDMPANESNPTAQQQLQQNTTASNTSLQRGAAQSTLTHAAAVNGDKTSLNKLLNNSHDDINAGDQFGRTPLMLAVLADRLECAEILLKHGAKVNSSDNAGRTALHWSAYKGNVRLSKLLLAKGANWKIKDKEGQSALHLATRHDNTKCLMLLIKQLEPGEQDEQDNAKRTALHWSSSYGNEEAVKLLIKHNSNIGIPDTDGKTPLHWAASAGHDVSAVNTLQLILETEPSVITWQDYEGRTALHLAVAQGNETIAQQLISFQTNLVKCNVSVLDNMFRTPLHWAAVLGHTHIVDLLLDAGASVTSSDANGATPLHYAAQNNHAETVAAFLRRENITDEPDLEGRTALMWGAGKGADAVIRRMVEISQPDINATDKTGATALHAAAMCGHPNTIQVLLELGANVNILDQSKHTPLFRAAEMGHTCVVKVLIEGGAQVDILDQEGRSPLHWAALGGHACICSILIGEGIYPNIQDFNGRTPLQCASYGGFTNSISLLLEKGADPNSQDSEGMTALHWCCSSGYLDAAKLLLDYRAFPNHMEYTEERLTPLDFALLNEHHHVAQYMIEQGALSITGIRDIAAIRVQSYFRGYRVRKTFVERKKLLMKHEQLRKDALKKKVEMTKKNEVDESPQDGNIKDQGIQEGSENCDETRQESNTGNLGSGKGSLREGTEEEAGMDSSKPSKKLCWESESGADVGDEDSPNVDKVDSHSQDQVSPDSGRGDDLTPGNDPDQLQPADLDPRNIEAEHKLKDFPKEPDTAILNTHLSERNVRLEESQRDDVNVTDMADQTDNSANANTNNSNSNNNQANDCEHLMSGHDPEPPLILQSMEERQKLVERERRRQELWRGKSDSAVVIQRAWQNFKQTQDNVEASTINHNLKGHHHQQPNSQPDPRAHRKTDPRARSSRTHRRQVAAACTIQQTWRCYRENRQKELLHGSKYNHSWKTQLNAITQTLMMNQIYGKKQVAAPPRPGAPSVRRARPHYQQYIPSSAALSFNFAMDQYRPFVQNIKAPSSSQQMARRSKHSTPHKDRSPSADLNRAGSAMSSKSVSSFSYNYY